MLIVAVVGLLVGPSLWYLLSVFKRRATTGASAHGTRVMTVSFVASLQSTAAPVFPPRGADAFSAQALDATMPATASLEWLAPVLTVSLAIAATPLITTTYSSVRQRIQYQRSQSQRRAGAMMPGAGHPEGLAAGHRTP